MTVKFVDGVKIAVRSHNGEKISFQMLPEHVLRVYCRTGQMADRRGILKPG